MGAANCLFCKIFRGEIPVQAVARTEDALAFRDLNPQAPSHVLVIPKRHVEHLSEFMAIASPEEVHALFALAAEVGTKASSGGYRVVTNQGVDAGQTVFHLHLHVLAGRAMRWPPG
jgi:histidine triad (HIT) family protein